MNKYHDNDSLHNTYLGQFLRGFCEENAIDRASLFRYDSESRLIQGVIALQKLGDLEIIDHFLLGCPPSRGVALQNVAQGFNPYILSNSPEEHLRLGIESGMRGYAAVPIAHDGRIVGVLTAMNDSLGRPILETELPAMIEAASLAGPELAVLEVTTPADLMGSIVEGIDDGLCIIGTGGWINYANEALARMYGYRREDLLAFHVDRLFEAFNEEGKPIETQPGAGGSDELWNRRADGRLFPVRLQRREIRHTGEFQCQIGTVKDLSKTWTLAQTECDSAAAPRKQSELDASLKMTFALQNRVNNPLQVILGSLQLLPLRGALTDRQSGLAENAIAAVVQISEVMRQMASFTPVETIDSSAGPIVDTVASFQSIEMNRVSDPS